MYRKGQEKAVFVYRIISPGTIEDRVKEVRLKFIYIICFLLTLVDCRFRGGSRTRSMRLRSGVLTRWRGWRSGLRLILGSRLGLSLVANFEVLLVLTVFRFLEA